MHTEQMAIKDTKWYRYINENGHKFYVWFIFLFVTTVLVFLTIRIISGLEPEKADKLTIEEVKVYFPKNEPDTLLRTIHKKLGEIQETIEVMRKDSFPVSVQKVIK